MMRKNEWKKTQNKNKIRFQSFNSKKLITSCLALNIDIIASYYFVFLYNLLKSCLWIDIYISFATCYTWFRYFCVQAFSHTSYDYIILKSFSFFFFHFVVAIWLNLYMFTWFQLNTIMCELLCILGSSGNKN